MNQKTPIYLYYHGLHTYFRTRTPRPYDGVYRRKKVAKYIVSGGVATVTNLVVLYTLTDFFRVYYLVSSVFAFIVSVIVSFSMQKFWTFEDTSRDALHMQFAFYSLVILANLVLNTFLVYAFVEWLSLWYLIAQFLAGMLIAIISFFAYRNLVFKR
ncbi:MAG TPA: GtrA family protein [Candidatus Paceibacterota bacterium]|nr:GtrA family protein [Candidatus Paceibacterota bacterium]